MFASLGCKDSCSVAHFFYVYMCVAFAQVRRSGNDVTNFNPKRQQRDTGFYTTRQRTRRTSVGVEFLAKILTDGQTDSQCQWKDRIKRKRMNEISSTSMSKIKKRVSFADAAGFTLESVKTIPTRSGEYNATICTSSVWNVNNNNSRSLPSPRPRGKNLSPCFTEPCKTSSFFERVYSQNVCLESIVCDDFVVAGTIRVTNIGFAKELTVRFTLDNWKSYRDIWADYFSSSMDGKTDKFWFRIAVPVDSPVDLEIKFAIRYCIGGREFWDNNLDRNYKIQFIETCQ